MTTTDRIGHVGYALIFLGMLAIAFELNGFPLRLAGESIWIGLGIYLRLTSIWFWGSVFAAVDCVGWWYWS